MEARDPEQTAMIKIATKAWRVGSVLISKLNSLPSAILGWEFRFLVPISGTPIGSGIPIPFLIPKIPVEKFFSNSAVEKLKNQNSDSKNRNSEKKINVGIQYTSFRI